MFEDTRNHEQIGDFHRLYQQKIVLDAVLYHLSSEGNSTK